MLVRSSGVLYSDVMKFYAIFNKTMLFSSLVIVVLLTRLRSCRGEDEGSSTEEKGGVPIIRQINKMNDDGTYTYGYEAADGSFKIETRDVLGNVKGMFGFIDESGELKRVSYTANNETGFKNSMLHPPTSTPYSTARPSPSSGGDAEAARRPVLILKNIPLVHGSTKGPVIQHIPKKPQLQRDEEDEIGNINGRRFPNVGGSANDSQSNSVSGEERAAVGGGVVVDESNKSQNGAGTGANPLRKVLVSKRPVDDKDIAKGKGGNSLRRQLSRGALDLRGEMSHIYAGGVDGRYSSNLPSHLDALMSELRPIQVVRTAAPESIGYQTVDVEAVPQEINDISTTTEFPAYYGSRKYVHPSGPPGYISRYRPAGRSHAAAISEETQQYLQEVTPRQAPPSPPPPQPPQVSQPLPTLPQTLPYALNVPFGGQASPNYQTQPHYYDQVPYSIPPTLRDELMAVVYNYLQARLGPIGQSSGYYPHPAHPAAYPRSPYTNPYPYHSPLVNPLYSSPYPFVNPYLPQQFYPYANPATGIYPAPSQTPYAGPNVQFAPRQEPPHRRVASSRLPTRSAIAADDADLLQMLLASPTRMPISQLKYSPTTERSLNSRVTQPIRNLQIITETTESRPVTTETPER